MKISELLTKDQIRQYYKYFSIGLLVLGLLTFFITGVHEIAILSNFGFHFYFYFMKVFASRIHLIEKKSKYIKAERYMLKLLVHFFLLASLLGILTFISITLLQGKVEMLLMAVAMSGLALGCLSVLLKLKQTEPQQSNQNI